MPPKRVADTTDGASPAPKRIKQSVGTHHRAASPRETNSSVKEYGIHRDARRTESEDATLVEIEASEALQKETREGHLSTADNLSKAQKKFRRNLDQASPASSSDDPTMPLPRVVEIHESEDGNPAEDADEPYELVAMQPVDAKGHKTNSKFDNLEEMLTNPESPLVSGKLRDILLGPEAWAVLSKEEAEQVLSLFPDQAEVMNGDTTSARPDFAALSSNNNFRHDVARYQEGLGQGTHDAAWIQQAQEAHKERTLGTYDTFLASDFQDRWSMPMPQSGGDTVDDNLHPDGAPILDGQKSTLGDDTNVPANTTTLDDDTNVPANTTTLDDDTNIPANTTTLGDDANTPADTTALGSKFHAFGGTFHTFEDDSHLSGNLRNMPVPGGHASILDWLASELAAADAAENAARESDSQSLKSPEAPEEEIEKQTGDGMDTPEKEDEKAGAPPRSGDKQEQARANNNTTKAPTEVGDLEFEDANVEKSNSLIECLPNKMGCVKHEEVDHQEVKNQEVDQPQGQGEEDNAIPSVGQQNGDDSDISTLSSLSDMVKGVEHELAEATSDEEEEEEEEEPQTGTNKRSKIKFASPTTSAEGKTKNLGDHSDTPSLSFVSDSEVLMDELALGKSGKFAKPKRTKGVNATKASKLTKVSKVTKRYATIAAESKAPKSTHASNIMTKSGMSKSQTDSAASESSSDQEELDNAKKATPTKSQELQTDSEESEMSSSSADTDAEEQVDHGKKAKHAKSRKSMSETKKPNGVKKGQSKKATTNRIAKFIQRATRSTSKNAD